MSGPQSRYASVLAEQAGFPSLEAAILAISGSACTSLSEQSRAAR